VILFLGRTTREEWTHVLGCGKACEANAVDEMKSIKAYFDQYGKIAGLVIYGLEPTVSEYFIYIFQHRLVT